MVPHEKIRVYVSKVNIFSLSKSTKKIPLTKISAEALIHWF